MHAERAGFTLIEVLVALSIGAVVLLSARTLLEGVSDHASATVRAARLVDVSANTERTVRQVVGNVALAPDLQPTFVGTPTEATFESWCPSARGGLEPCRVRLFAQHGDTGAEVHLSLSTGTQLLVRRGTPGRLRYLAEAADGGHWYAEWNDVLSPPLAIGVLAGPDTLFLRIGRRR
jgi:prepilin-type N-terminal cleavage/methylation domain-containing protein